MGKGNETYYRIIGYDFGGFIYNGSMYYGQRRNYEFQFTDSDGETGTYITGYKGFREIIDQYDWPRAK
jgi:hypothetical protein